MRRQRRIVSRVYKAGKLSGLLQLSSILPAPSLPSEPTYISAFSSRPAIPFNVVGSLQHATRACLPAYYGDGAYDVERRPVRLFDAKPSVAPYPEEASRQLWREHVFGALPLCG